MTMMETTTADGVMVNGEPASASAALEPAAVEPAASAPTAPQLEPTKRVVGGEEVFDFTDPKKPVKFAIDDDVFIAVRDLPALTALEFGQYANTLDTSADMGEQAEAVRKMFDMILTKDSATRFIERLESKDEPIGATQMNSIMMWLMERYGFRPTEPSEASSDGS